MKIKLLSSLAGFATLLITGTIAGQAPSMGTTAGFVIFTTNGAVGNSGITLLTGHVGSNSGSSTGFGNVNGTMYNNDGVTGTASADLLSLYGQLNTSVPTLFPSNAMGNGQTLNAGIYSIAGNTTLNNTLTLDGQSDANAVFIFQIQGTFSSGSNANVILINGAKACNVFWKVEGQVNLASGTFMKGNIVANNAAISIASGVSLEGRALSIAGAITVNNILAYTPSGCGSPTLTGPASPTLGVAECYAIFSGNGPVSNTGSTFASGDIGTNVGLTTGFNALNVTGKIHPIPDGHTNVCATDLLTAYTHLNGIPADIELLYPAEFGRNLVLTPHAYIMNGAATFVDTLYLDARNVPGAVFVIRVNGAFTSASNAKVALMNGTLAKNVFWQIEGALDLGDYTEFVGTVVTNNGAIDLGTGVNVNGRTLTTDGAVQTDAVNVTLPAACTSTVTALNEDAVSVNNVCIYPNPFSNAVSISNPGIEDMEVLIFDATGKRILSIMSVSSNLPVNIKLSPGLYFYSILSNQKTIKTGKLVSL